MKFTVIGISDKEHPAFSPEIKEKIKEGSFFAGGERHLGLIKELLPDNYTWINVSVPLDNFFSTLQKQHDEWIIFASGDPLFFGIANTLRRHFPDSAIAVYPHFNSLQQLAHVLNFPYGMARIVTLTGRPWAHFDKALLDNECFMGILTDKNKTPASIASRMLEFGYDNYLIHVGEHMGGSKQHVRTLSLAEAASASFTMPNCLFLEQTHPRPQQQGIHDNEFNTLSGRPAMITKMPIRLASLSLMGIKQRSVFWDIGACTGSISVEAKIMQPLLDVHSFEIRENSRELVMSNAKKFGTPISFYQGDFLQTDVADLPLPDVVFLGGYGGNMHQILDKVSLYLKSTGIIGFNAVSIQSKDMFMQWGKENHFNLLDVSTIHVDTFNPVTIIIIQKI